MGIVRVELGERSYDIEIRPGVIDDIGNRLRGLNFKSRVALVTNPLVGGLYGERVKKSLMDAGFGVLEIMVPDSESSKCFGEVSKAIDALIEARFERSNPIVALGGGVIGDLAGFIAAIYLRGVPYVQVPTTLLSQVDSSVGGKTAINHPKGKNLIGAFYQPRAVYIDPVVLTTLDKRDFRAGLAEVIKYGVIKDERFFEFLERNSAKLLEPTDELTHAIERSCAIKAEVVGSDETEQGLRAILNFGHTFGHAIETLSGYGQLRHGEAVAIGMCMAARLSQELGMTDNTVVKRIVNLIGSTGLPTVAPKLPSGQMLSAMRLDKKVVGGSVRFVLARKLSDVVVEGVPEPLLEKFLSEQNL